MVYVNVKTGFLDRIINSFHSRRYGAGQRASCKHCLRAADNAPVALFF